MNRTVSEEKMRWIQRVALDNPDMTQTQSALAKRFDVSISALNRARLGWFDKRSAHNGAVASGKKAKRHDVVCLCGNEFRTHKPTISSTEAMCGKCQRERVADFTAPQEYALDRRIREDNALATAWSIIESRFRLFEPLPTVKQAQLGGFRPMRLPCRRVAVDVMVATQPSDLSSWFANRMRVRQGRR